MNTVVTMVLYPIELQLLRYTTTRRRSRTSFPSKRTPSSTCCARTKTAGTRALSTASPVSSPAITSNLACSSPHHDQYCLNILAIIPPMLVLLAYTCIYLYLLVTIFALRCYFICNKMDIPLVVRDVLF